MAGRQMSTCENTERSSDHCQCQAISRGFTLIQEHFCFSSLSLGLKSLYYWGNLEGHSMLIALLSIKDHRKLSILSAAGLSWCSSSLFPRLAPRAILAFQS